MTTEPKAVDNLEAVKVGDVFMAYEDSRYSEAYLKRVVCMHITPKQARIGGVNYWKKDASEVGSATNRWSRGAVLYQFDAELWRADTQRRDLRIMRDRLANLVEWDKVPDSDVSELYRRLVGHMRQKAKG